MTNKAFTFIVCVLSISAFLLNACSANSGPTVNNIEQQPAKQPSTLTPVHEKNDSPALLEEASTPPLIVDTTPKACSDIGCPAPDFTLFTPTGSELALMSLKGKKVILAFLSTRCSTCLEVIVCLQQVYGNWLRDQMEVVAIISREEAADVERWKHIYGVENPVVLDPEGTLLATYKTEKVPGLYFLDSNGVIQDIKYAPFDDCAKSIDSILRKY